jgi:signal peptidase I
VGPQQADNTREIVETVVFVVVLVLLLKSFTAEAFVIPTGSMAETLWGYQKVVDCPHCKYQFPVNCSQEVDPQSGRPPVPVTGCTCPNCFAKLGFKADADTGFPGYRGDEQRTQIANPGWGSGDRVLVSKFAYELFGIEPTRLDVVVFKFPGDEPGTLWPMSGPQKDHVPMNYIKRLIGLPGETILIHHGKLYSWQTSAELKKQYAEKDFEGCDTAAKREQRSRELWRLRYTHQVVPPGSTDYDASRYAELVDQFAQHRFKIIRKPPETLLTMRRIVYDNDYPADDFKTPRWPTAPGWTAGTENDFTCAPTNGSTRDWLHYQHIVRPDGQRGRDGKPQLISDVMGYNGAYPSSSGAGVSAGNWVGDLMLECQVTVDKLEGEFTLELSKGVDRFQAVWDLGTGKCTLWRLAMHKEPQELQTAQTPLKKGTYRVRFANVDQRLTVWVEYAVVEWKDHAVGVDYVAPDDERPTDNDREPASIGSKGAAVRVRHLSLWRDTYYTCDASSPDVKISETEWSGPGAWTAHQLMPFRSMYVQPGHYLCLGDNSPQSSDGRSWGLVPRRLLLGRAQLVYYPFYAPIWPLSSKVNRVGVIR